MTPGSSGQAARPRPGEAAEHPLGGSLSPSSLPPCGSRASWLRGRGSDSQEGPQEPGTRS